MSTIHRRIKISIAAFFLTGIVISFFSAFAQDKPLTIIGNEVGVPEQMNMKDFRSVIMGEKQRWNSSTPVVLALMKSSTKAGISTSRKIFDMSIDEFNKYWLALVFQGKVKAPVFFHSASELETFVAETPGAIGVVELSPTSKSRVISVDGKKSF
jgi:hypothetical protein